MFLKKLFYCNLQNPSCSHFQKSLEGNLLSKPWGELKMKLLPDSQEREHSKSSAIEK